MWEPNLGAVPDEWRAVAPELRGEAGVTMNDLAGDVIDLLDHLGVSRAAVVGCSMGGYVLFEMLKSAPAYLSAVGLVSTRPGPDNEEGRKNRQKMIALVDAEGVEAVAAQMVPKLLGKTSIESRPEARAAVHRIIEGNTTEGIDGGIRAIRDRPDSTDLLPGIGCPALVIAGDEDVLIPVADVEAMQRGLPRSHFVVLSRSGHLSNLETPADFSTALADFLRAHL